MEIIILANGATENSPPLVGGARGGGMMAISSSELLKDKDILNEINRYKWIESEKAGSDIGFERAAREWINIYSKQYLTEHLGKSAVLWIKSQPFYGILNKEIKIR